MRAMRRGLIFAVALGALAASKTGYAQQAAPQYGYPAAQKAMPSGQGNYPCQVTPTGCYVEKYGCEVTVCRCPCTTGTPCQVINSQIPPIHPVPSCQEPNVCTIVDEGPPTVAPQNITIHRNCYVPIKVVTTPGPSTVTPVNIQVNWREVHVLCGADGKPLGSAQAAAVLQQLNAQVASAMPAPSADSASAAAIPEKRWVWLEKQKVFGFGYQGADGYWVIDQGSKRPTLPEGQAAANAPPAAAAVTTTASN